MNTGNNKHDFYDKYDLDLPDVNSCKELLELKISDLSSGEKAKEFNAGALADYSVFIEGYLDEKTIANKTVDLLNALSIQNFIHILPSEVNEVSVQTLRLEGGYTLIKLPEAPIDYYTSFFKEILDENGVVLKDVNAEDVIFQLKRRFRSELSEAKILMLVAMALDKSDGKPLGLEEFGIEEQRPPSEILKALQLMPGLNNQKRYLLEQAAMLKEAKKNPSLMVRRNLILAGNPGTFKSGFVKILSEYCSSIGVCGSTYIEATRERLIGSYVGHTSPRIKKIFDSAAKDSGVIVIDEAGWMLNNSSGGNDTFKQEAVKEIVRYCEMPEYKDISICFILYKSEVDAFLSLDDGLKSRVAQIIEFEDYTSSELIEIFAYMVKNQGYSLEAGSGWEKLIKKYCDSAIDIAKKTDAAWGNAREIRKLCQSVVTVHALKDTDSNVLTFDEIKEGINRLTDIDLSTKPKVFGFRPVEEESVYAESII